MANKGIKVNANTSVSELETLEDIYNAWIYSICRNHTAKMADMVSISTNTLLNEHCRERVERGVGICKDCYADRQVNTWTSMQPKLTFNTEFLTSKIWDIESIPNVNCLYFRFEAFGDLMPIKQGGINQFANYCNFARVNKETKFALWTKNPWVIKQALKQGVVIPKNLVIVFSVLATDFLITDSFVSAVKKAYPFVNKVFAVYTKEFINDHDVVVNCGARSCFKCHRCYSKKTDVVVIEEKK